MTTDNQQPETAADVLTRCPRCGCEWGSEEIERGTCFACGWEDGGKFETDMLLCPVCGGTGADDPNFDGWDDEGWLPCEECNGTGMIGIK